MLQQLKISKRYMVGEIKRQPVQHLQHAFGQIPVVLLRDLGAVGRSFKHWRVVVDVLDVDHHGRVVFLQVVRRRQAQLVLWIASGDG